MPYKNKLIEFFEELKKAEYPLILHNGLYDLLFTYHNFIKPLPDTLSQFVTGVFDAFPPIYDTKYIAEYHMKESISSLEYLYHKSERANLANKTNKQFFISMIDATASIIKYMTHSKGKIESQESRNTSVTICHNFRTLGFCKLDKECSYSHDINLLLDLEENRENKNFFKRKRKRSTEKTNGRRKTWDRSQSDLVNNLNDSIPEIVPLGWTGKPYDFVMVSQHTKHNPGFDAFATGSIFAYYWYFFPYSRLITDMINKIFFPGRRLPLLIKSEKNVIL